MITTGTRSRRVPGQRVILHSRAACQPSDGTPGRPLQGTEPTEVVLQLGRGRSYSTFLIGLDRNVGLVR